MENIVEKRRNCSSGAISPLFHNIFNISLTSKVQLPISLLNVVNQIIFSSILQTWYVELRISRSISESPLEFEITRVDCIIICLCSDNFSHINQQWTMTCWDRLLAMLILMVAAAHVSTAELAVTEQCWDSFNTCMVNSAFGTGTRWQSCQLR